MPEGVDNQEYEYRKQRYEAYTKERDALRKDSLEVSGRYDKAVLALAGGALALSITFLEKIAPQPAAWTFILLGAAWLCLIASVLLELYALSTSQTVTNERIGMAEEDYRQFLLSLPNHPQVPEPLKRAEAPEVVEGLARRTRRFNDWSRWLLSIGVLLLCAFSLFNLPGTATGKTNMSSKPLNESKGSYIAPSTVLPPPPPPPSSPRPAPQAPPAAPSAPAAQPAPAAPAAPPASAPQSSR